MFSVYYVNRSEKPEFVWRTSIWMSLGCTDTLEVFCKKDVVRNFSKFTSKKIWQSLLLNKVAGLLKKRLWHRCFPVNFAKFLRTPFSQNTSRRLLLALLRNVHKSYEFLSKLLFFKTYAYIIIKSLKRSNYLGYQKTSNSIAALRCIYASRGNLRNISMRFVRHRVLKGSR